MWVNKKVVFSLITINIILSSAFLICNSIFKNGQITYANQLIFIFSLLFLDIGVFFLYMKGLSNVSVFMIIYWGALSINTLHLSGAQSNKNFDDFYYFVIGGVTFSALLYFGEYILNLKKIKIAKKISAKNISTFLLVCYIVMNLILFKKTGIRVFTGMIHSSQTERFIVPGISGIITMLMWILLMLIPFVSKRKTIIIFCVTILFNGVLMFKRGDIIRILLFGILYYLFMHKNEILRGKIVKKIIFLFISVFIVFSSMGNLRTKLRAAGSEVNATEAINASLDSNINLREFGWLVGYTIINFDVLKLYYNDDPAYKMDSVGLPVARLLGGNSKVNAFMNRRTDEMNRGIHGFNAAPFQSNYIYDFGMFFFLELVVLGTLISIFISITKVYHLTGAYIFILLMTVLTIFGDYYTLPNYVFALATGIILTMFIKKDVGKE